MVENGHSWSSIQSYSLSEIGLFFKTIVNREKLQNIAQITQAWMGNNLSKEGLDNILKKESGSKIRKPTVKEVNTDWRRLKMFMSSGAK